ncbi:stage III sporulation protein AD [Garciella nitratireducens]|uniref:Stage III sporulation protein AD n=1 Tax=Garciella nitratireducens DSM 15102 TaxID=1121911 RepID=A0A1T4K477_9FIRM|nr:stage III sporulation protein AD [Garciella nitratireducens]RBP46664.1 stage III sporulation protein AD [Garciella nitratireducens]SJZ37250.1 stage III sporulation protein AD [Garciella nitratireducens DSM 15102]
MEIIQIISIGLIATILSVILKKDRPEFSMLIGLVAGIIIFFFVITKLKVVLEVFQDLSSKMDINMKYINIIFKIIGIAYLTEFGAQVCKDAGEGSIATKIEFGGKVLIMIIAVPILMALLDLILKIIP